MKRPFPRIEVLGLTAALAFAGSCTPNNSVKPGAPVLTEMVVVENGTPYVITPAAPICTSEMVEGATCNAQKDTPCQRLAGSDGGVAVKPNWCRCRGVSSCPEFAPGPEMSTWDCFPFAPTTSFIAVFDRLLDTAPFEPADGGPLTNVATVDPTLPVSQLDSVYTPNGAPEFDDAGNFKTLLFPIYEHCVYGVILNDNGPNLAMVPDPQLPTGQTVTIKLDGTNVRAKDGRTPFSGTGALLDGMLTFQTAAFDADFAVPLAAADAAVPPAVDGGAADAAAPVAPVPADMSPVTITFTAPVDLTKDVVDINIAATDLTTKATTQLPIILMQPDGGAANAVLAAAPTPTTVTLTPVGTWPANSTITVSLTATTTDLIGDQLPAARSGSFTTLP
jgi:hypothetical protein